jgi:hypothetical protein
MGFSRVLVLSTTTSHELIYMLSFVVGVQDAAFLVRPGNAGKGVSLESVNFPGRFLRHSGFVLYVHKNDGSALFKKDSTFIVHSKGTSPPPSGLWHRE